MIAFIAGAVQASAGETSCATAKYVVPEAKRWLPASVKRWLPRSLVSRLDPASVIPVEATWCSCIGFVAMNYYGPYWKYQTLASQGTEYIYPHFDFAIEPQSELLCAIIEDAAPLVAAALPEFDVEEAILEEGDVNMSCDLGGDNNASVDLGTTG